VNLYSKFARQVPKWNEIIVEVKSHLGNWSIYELGRI